MRDGFGLERRGARVRLRRRDAARRRKTSRSHSGFTSFDPHGPWGCPGFPPWTWPMDSSASQGPSCGPCVWTCRRDSPLSAASFSMNRRGPSRRIDAAMRRPSTTAEADSSSPGACSVVGPRTRPEGGPRIAFTTRPKRTESAKTAMGSALALFHPWSLLRTPSVVMLVAGPVMRNARDRSGRDPSRAGRPRAVSPPKRRHRWAAPGARG